MNTAIKDAIAFHKQAIDEFEKNSPALLQEIADAITKSLNNKGTVYLCGNGGSAADCQHIAGEFVGRFRKERKALPGVALSTDTSVITCLGNDYDYKDIFSRQVEALMDSQDMLWAFSTSGTSANVIKAAKAAKEKGAKVIAFTGKINSELEKISDYCICANANWTSTSQEVHQLSYHIICDIVEQNFVE